MAHFVLVCLTAKGVAMWKASPAETVSIAPATDPALASPYLPALSPNVRSAVLSAGQSCIGKDLTVVGEITGAASLESLFIDGSVEGSIHLPGSRVTVGVNGRVTARISASDIVVLGRIHGNLTASNRLDIRATGSVTGDASAPRISIEDGALIQGNVAVLTVAAEPVVAAEPAVPAREPVRPIRVQSELRTLRVRPSLQSA
jgi:cytoskeletal protein CcmA (bactofilin family)